MSDPRDNEIQVNPEVEAMLRRVLGRERLTQAERARHRDRLLRQRGLRVPPTSIESRRHPQAGDEDAWDGAMLLPSPAADDQPRRPERVWIGELGKLAAAALIFAVVGVILALALRGDGDSRPGDAPPTVAPQITVTARAATPVARIDVGQGPFGIAAGSGAIWVPNNGDGTLMRVDETTQQVVATLDIGSLPTAFDADPATSLFPSMVAAASDTSVWVSKLVESGGTVRGSVVEVDPATNSVVREIALPVRPTYLALDGDSLWVTSRLDNAVLRLATGAGELDASIAVSQPEYLAIGEGAVWVTSAGTGAVVRIDPATNAISDVIALEATPVGITVGEGAVWVTVRSDGGFSGSLVRVDPATREIVAEFPIVGPGSVVAGHGSIWIVRAGVGVVRFDPLLNQVVALLAIACEPGSLVASEEAIWATGLCTNRLMLIDPLS